MKNLLRKILKPFRKKYTKQLKALQEPSTNDKIDIALEKRIKKLDDYIEQQESEIQKLSLSILLKEKDIN